MSKPAFKCALSLSALFLVSSLLGQTDSPSQPAFSATPAALQASFSKLQQGKNGITILLEEEQFELDAQGNALERRHLIFKAWTKDGAEAWDSVEADWSPWQQDRPQFRARVIMADGTVRELDPATIAETAARDDDEDLETDRRRLRAPLPAMAAGSIVEQEIVTRQTRSAIDGAGEVHSFFFGAGVPVEQTRVVVRAPQSLPLKFKTLLLPNLQVKDQTRAGVREIVMEHGAMEPLKDIPPMLPSDQPRGPRVVFSTGASWKAAATAYSAAVERQLRGADVRSFLPRFAANATREEKVRAIVEKINREIRYTGLEFSEAAVVPHTPAEVLEHKYGDCKDNATLAVALLRAAGVPAYVALLRASTGADVQPDLPGMGEFNHAIVYAPGTPDYWLDLTDPDLRLGVISTPNQGRLSLIARPETTDLLRTPELSAEQNKVVETREFQLSELGRAHVVESSEAFGIVDRNYRGSFGGLDQAESKENLEDYVKTVYGEAKIAAVEHGDADDLSKPFRLRIELNDAQRGTSGRTEAAVAIFTSHLLERLPGFFLRVPDEENGKETPRTQDFVISEPYTYEYHYKITAPPGFRLRQLPESTQQSLGIASVNVKFTKVNDAEVTADLRFVMPQRRMTADQGLALRTAALEFQKNKPLMVYFDQVGETALAQGNVAEALTSFGDLRKLHPNESLHALQYARALLAAGAGESARAEARRAVSLEPKSVIAQLQLAEILKTDLVGRDLVPGIDRDGAVDAYRKALEIEPDDAEMRANLAILLEHDRSGERYGKGARLDEAITEYQKILKKLADLGVPQNYAIALFRAGRMQELKDYLRGQPDSETNQTLSVIAEAALNGVPAAVTRATAVSGVAARQRVLASAAQTLILVRRFDLAVGLLEAATAGAPSPASVASTLQTLRRAKPAEQLPKTASTPEDAVRILLARLVLYPDHVNDWADTLGAFEKEEAVAHPAALRALVGAMQNEFSGVQRDVAADIILASVDLSRDGDDDKGYTIQTGNGNQGVAFYVAREGTEYKIVGNEEDPEPMARLVLKLVKEGRLEQGAALLDRLRREYAGGNADEPLSGSFPRLWQTNQTDRSVDAIRLAAGALIAGKKYPELDELIPLFERARSQADASRAPSISRVLTEFYLSLERFPEAQGIARALSQQFPQSSMALALTVRAAYATGGRAAGRAAIEANQARFTQNTLALRGLADIAMTYDDAERSSEIIRGIVASGRATVIDYNQLAWGDLMRDKVTADTLEVANRGIVLGGTRPSTGMMHTAAAVSATLGKPSDARTTLLQRMKLNNSDEPTDDDWYVFGLIAEKYGLRDEAATMYRKLKKPESDLGLAASSYALAQRRLEALSRR